MALTTAVVVAVKERLARLRGPGGSRSAVTRRRLSLLHAFLDGTPETPENKRNRCHRHENSDFRDADFWELHTRNIRDPRV